ncbi:MAG: exonuclease [Actinobacteria bacterium]|nr:exonuclease [Actinomycetota bacterium]
MARRDCYISVDIEADGPIPGPYSMLSIGMVVAGRFDGTTFVRADIDDPEQRFYAELKPISSQYDAAALAVAGLDRDRLQVTGEDPALAMTRAHAWVRKVSRGDRPVFAAFPLGFDWMFSYWYFVNFATKGSPFGHSTHLDIKTLYAVKSGEPIVRSIKRNMPPGILGERPHTHHALDDATEQADLLANLFEWRRS